jgi:hypothetical protein
MPCTLLLQKKLHLSRLKPLPLVFLVYLVFITLAYRFNGRDVNDFVVNKEFQQKKFTSIPMEATEKKVKSSVPRNGSIPFTHR